MPAMLAALLPMILRMLGGYGASKGAMALGSRLAPQLAQGVAQQGVRPMIGKALQSGIGQLGAWGAGDFATSGLLSSLESPQSQTPVTNSENLAMLSQGNLGGFDRMIQERQLRGTLSQALAQAGIDINSLSKVL